MMHVLYQPATAKQVKEMQEVNDTYIAVAVDVERGIAAGGGEVAADAAAALLEAGSRQEHVWGAAWVPKTREVRCEALLNAHPQLKNRALEIQDAKIRKKVEEVIRHLLEV